MHVSGTEEVLWSSSITREWIRSDLRLETLSILPLSNCKWWRTWLTEGWKSGGFFNQDAWLGFGGRWLGLGTGWLCRRSWWYGASSFWSGYFQFISLSSILGLGVNTDVSNSKRARNFPMDIADQFYTKWVDSAFEVANTCEGLFWQVKKHQCQSGACAVYLLLHSRPWGCPAGKIMWLASLNSKETS
jgi:hypothetical protein